VKPKGAKAKVKRKGYPKEPKEPKEPKGITKLRR